MRRVLMSALLAGALGLLAVAPAAADRPMAFTIQEIAAGEIDPCTGATHDVTFDVTFLFHDHDGRSVARGVRTLTTTLGYSGRGTSSFVANDRVEMFRFTDMLTDDSGNRIRAGGVVVVDLRSETVRVDRFQLSCVGASGP
jgi:hypothetical protein